MLLQIGWSWASDELLGQQKKFKVCLGSQYRSHVTFGCSILDQLDILTEFRPTDNTADPGFQHCRLFFLNF